MTVDTAVTTDRVPGSKISVPDFAALFTGSYLQLIYIAYRSLE